MLDNLTYEVHVPLYRSGFVCIRVGLNLFLVYRDGTMGSGWSALQKAVLGLGVIFFVSGIIMIIVQSMNIQYEESHNQTGPGHTAYAFNWSSTEAIILYAGIVATLLGIGLFAGLNKLRQGG